MTICDVGVFGFPAKGSQVSRPSDSSSDASMAKRNLLEAIMESDTYADLKKRDQEMFNDDDKGKDQDITIFHGLLG